MPNQQTATTLALPAVFQKRTLPLDMPFLVRLNRSISFHEIAADLPGWSEIVDAYDRVTRMEEAAPTSVDTMTPLVAALAILEGEDPSKAVDGVAAETEQKVRQTAYNETVDALRIEVSERAVRWVLTHLHDFENVLTERVRSIFERAASEITHLEGVYEPADLANYPHAAGHWAALVPLAHELWEVEHLAESLRVDFIPPNDYRDVAQRNWPLIGIFDHYETVWERYFLSSGMAVGGVGIAPERAPWDHPDQTVRLRHVAELRPTARVRLGGRYREYSDALAERSVTDRQALRKAEAQKQYDDQHPVEHMTTRTFWV